MTATNRTGNGTEHPNLRQTNKNKNKNSFLPFLFCISLNLHYL